MLIRPILVSVVFASLLAVPGVEAAKPKMNPQAGKLAKLLKPARSSARVGEGDLDKAAARLVSIIKVLEENARGSGPPPSSLLEKAFDEYLPNMNPRRVMETRNVSVKAWDEARHLGLFDDEGEFSRKITRGPETGKDAIFEYIAPVEAVPYLSADPINVRIVSPADRREGGALSDRDAAFTERLRALTEQETGEAKAVAVRKKEDSKAINDVWKNAVAEAGAAFDEEPNILLQGMKASSPGRRSKGRWAVTLRAVNQSQHATEVTLEVYLLGKTGEGRHHFLLAKRSAKLRLRVAEVHEEEYFSNSEKSYRTKVAGLDGLNLKNKKEAAKVKTEFRGWVARVLHKDEVVARAASMSTYLPYALEEYDALTSMP